MVFTAMFTAFGLLSVSWIKANGESSLPILFCPLTVDASVDKQKQKRGQIQKEREIKIEEKFEKMMNDKVKKGFGTQQTRETKNLPHYGYQ